MHEVIIGLQFTALIPILLFLIYRPSLNMFFKVLLASIFLSLAFDSLATYCSFAFKNNLIVICLYYICNAFLITYMWQRVPFYSEKSKKLIRRVGYSICGIMIFLLIYFKVTTEALYILSCFSVFLGLIFALHYYYQKIQLSSHTPPLRDPYFIAATGYILFCLSTIIILAVQIHYERQSFIPYIWTLRQIFYMIYNLIIAYAFFILYKIQVTR